MTQDRPLIGILLMIGFCAVAPLGDATAKILGDTIPLVQLLLVRFAIQAVVLLPIIFGTGISLRMSPRLLRITFLRTVLHIIGIAAMFTSLRYLPLADAVAIAFVMPFIMLAFGATFLGEEVGPRRIAACTVGFIGTLLVVQPSFAAVGWPALLPIVVAFVFSFYMLVSRHIAKECDPLALQTVSGFMATPMIVVLLAFTWGRDDSFFGIVTPNATETWLLLAIGVLGTCGHLLMTWSLRFAPSATVAPVQYLEIPFATFFGWLIFSDLPNGLAALGIAITMAAGLYVLFRERRLAQPRPSEA
ncbi:EamA family transporter [Aliihoeflea aestuarii]|jgi:drug/metabolite transporter (DMT)-like permease|uniref:DMT family transporter n=1 Tax=Aliihoeflea aestuarii TaxID=453840 RepID=UPI002094432D|nr:DMT family transporter [Aliihoeflea aestuarii]MCO6393045.1 EamA family transporter [Aliihoeflea aestuarii]